MLVHPHHPNTLEAEAGFKVEFCLGFETPIPKQNKQKRRRGGGGREEEEEE